MSREEVSPEHPTRIAAGRVKEVRRLHGWTAADLASRMAEAGFKWDRFTVQNFERGRRAALNVDEFLALAYVLDVAPAYLLLPIDDEEAKIAVTSTHVAPAWRVREWLRGRMHLIGQDQRTYHTQVPALEYMYPPKVVTDPMVWTSKLITPPEGKIPQRYFWPEETGDGDR